MKILTNTKNIKFLFSLLWVFFIARMTSYIDIEATIFQTSDRSWVYWLMDMLSITINGGLLVVLSANLFIQKKIPSCVILLIYPIFGLFGYLTTSEMHLTNFFVVHHFITLTSFFLFFSIIISNSMFDYKFQELLLKIIFLFIIALFIFSVFPNTIEKIYKTIDLRHTHTAIFSVFGTEVTFQQNINGQARIFLIMQIFFLILFLKFILNKSIVAIVFFSISVLCLSVIFFAQSRFNLIISFIFSYLLLFKDNNLNLKKKIFCILVITIVPLLSSQIYSKQSNRFVALEMDRYGEDKLLLNQRYNDNISTKNNDQISTKNNDQMVCSPSLNYLDTLLSGRLCGWEILLKSIKTNDLLFGKGFFADQVVLKHYEKTSSNSWINIFFNAGIVSLLICFLFVIIIFLKYFKIKNMNHTNIYISCAHCLFLYILLRSLFEDTLAFVNIDLLLLGICTLIVVTTGKKNKI